MTDYLTSAQTAAVEALDVFRETWDEYGAWVETDLADERMYFEGWDVGINLASLVQIVIDTVEPFFIKAALEVGWTPPGGEQ